MRQRRAAAGVIAGKYSRQIDYIVARLLQTVDFGSESVIFLQPKAGGWFDYLRGRLPSSRATVDRADQGKLLADRPRGHRAVHLALR